MAFVPLTDAQTTGTTLMVFLEGTLFRTRLIRHLFSPAGYIPIGHCAGMIDAWRGQGANLVYCTYVGRRRIELVRRVLRQHGLSGSRLYYRAAGERYEDLVAAARPAVLIEDDCRSIGGAWQMCITKVAPELKRSIRSIVVKEHQGIDHLPVNLDELCGLGR